jgi:hypothetical protein
VAIFTQNTVVIAPKNFHNIENQIFSAEKWTKSLRRHGART